jgi:hypothetical protein
MGRHGLYKAVRPPAPAQKLKFHHSPQAVPKCRETAMDISIRPSSISEF